MLDERQAAPRPDETFGPLVVGFVVRDGAPPPGRFTSELEREAILDTIVVEERRIS